MVVEAIAACITGKSRLMVIIGIASFNGNNAGMEIFALRSPV